MTQLVVAGSLMLIMMSLATASARVSLTSSACMYFGGKSFQTIHCTGTDEQTQQVTQNTQKHGETKFKAVVSCAIK